MTTVIHDLMEEEWDEIADAFENAKVISDNGTIKKCMGCFGCWVKTPGKCAIPDTYQDMGEILGKTDELIVISRMRFGSYSAFVKNVFDRSIPYVLPYFETRGGEMHHKARYENCIRMSAYFYGEAITEDEKETAKQLVEANAVNFNGQVKKVAFVESAEALKGELQHDIIA